MIEYIPIVFCFDHKYEKYAAVSIFSVLEHAKEAPTKIYCIVPSADVQKLTSVRALEAMGHDITVIGADDRLFSSWKSFAHFSRVSYLRLLIPDLIDEKKVIYLDSDLIVQSDLSALYNIPIDDFLLAGVIDPAGDVTTRLPRAYADRYINAGVLVMNLVGMRQDGFLEKCAQLYWRHHELLQWGDQCLINKYAESRKIIVEPKWNRLIFADQISRRKWNELVDSPIIHFTGPLKPWTADCIPDIASLWWKYANQLQSQLRRMET
jgi:lipopolysaccharide biosynthesis glycosyltransferase